MSWLKKLTSGLSKTSARVTSSLASLLGRPSIDAGSLEDLEDALISADLGTAAAARLAERVKTHKFEGEVTAQALSGALADGIADILEPVAVPLKPETGNSPHVVLLVGVNGSGKTTTAGKLAQHWRNQGMSVMLAAGDTFRAAAVEQLQVWGDRVGVPVIAGAPGADAAAVAFQALAAAREAAVDVLLIDTAGRLQNKRELMDELAKINRVIAKQDPAAPHDRVLVLDGTVGQNAHGQVEAFQEVTEVSGLIVTKLDGSARGGVVGALTEKFGLPVHAIGVGEGVEDLQPFDAADFARNLLGLG